MKPHDTSQPQLKAPTPAYIETLLTNGLRDEAKAILEIWNDKIDEPTASKIRSACGVDDTLAQSQSGTRLSSIPSITTEDWLHKFITVHPLMLELKASVRKLAPLEDSVLITGPTGTGKELIAQALHGDRKGRFVSINCPALHEHLIESELFGHTKGSFTGAMSDREGKLLYANNGTVFFDEIADLPMPMQGKILRAIQEKTITRLGENKERHVHCRFVCATHKNLSALIESGMFREDLYYRLSTFELRTECLYKRPEDTILIAKSLGAEGDFLQRLEETIANKLCRFDGNVRELQQTIRRWQVLGKL